MKKLLNTAYVTTEGAALKKDGETLVAEIALWNARRNTARALARLSDRQLADIGLLGADLNEVAARLRR
mgnify:CR=1 FL=1